jgi:beta-galactosidase
MAANGKTVSVLLLSPDEAKTLWKGRLEGQDRLVLTSDELSFRDQGIELRSVGDNHFSFSVYPALDHAPHASLSLKAATTNGMFQTYVATTPAKEIPVTVTKTSEAGEAPELKIGGAAGRALQPYPEAFGKSAAWSISVPADALVGLKNAYLQIDYQGDVARLFSGDDMIDDQFYYGQAWTIGLRAFEDRLKEPLMLTVMPLRKDAPIYLDDAAKARLRQTDQVAQVLSVKVVPEYALEID